MHADWGPGLLESFYRVVLAKSIRRSGLRVDEEYPVSCEYDGDEYRNVFRADLLVERSLLVELKSVETLQPVHSRQVLTYLRVMNLPLGLLLNMGSGLFKEGTRRILNTRANQSSLVDYKTVKLGNRAPS